MENCVNLRPGEDGVLEDPISFEEVTAEDLVTFQINGQNFCYGALTLLQYIDGQKRTGAQELILPERIVLSSAQVEYLYAVARGRYPQVFIVLEGDRATPFTFKTQEQATTFVSQRQRGAVYQIAQVDDPAMFDLLYPQGLRDLVPVFAVRDVAVENHPLVALPQWQHEESVIHNEAYEEVAPHSPIRPVRVLRPPVAPIRERERQRDRESNLEYERNRDLQRLRDRESNLEYERNRDLQRLRDRESNLEYERNRDLQRLRDRNDRIEVAQARSTRGGRSR